MKKITFLILIAITCYSLNAQVGIGTTTPDTSSALDISSTNSGLLIPRMTQAERDLITTPANGLLIFQTDIAPGFYYFITGTGWTSFASGGTDVDWTIVGNDIYNANTGNVGVGNTAPSVPFHITGSTTPPTMSTTTIYSNDFESGGITYNANPGNGCTTVPNIWHIAATSPEAGCTPCTNNRAYIEYDFTCAQDQTMVEGNFTPTSTTVDIAFNYHFEDFINESLFVVTLYNESTATVAATLLNLNDDTPNATYTGNHAVITGNNYSLRFQYVGTNDWGAAVDNILVTESSTASAGVFTFRLDDGTQASGYVLTSDANGNAYWADPSGLPGGGPGGDDGDWTVAGATMTNANSGQVVVSNSLAANSILYAENTNTATSESYGVHGVTNASDALGAAGVFGESANGGDFEIGVLGIYDLWGAGVSGVGFGTTVNDMPLTSFGTELLDMGVFGSVDFEEGVAIYGLNDDATDPTSFGVYYENNIAGTGTKSASIPTEKGNQLVYSMESPEIWFEDFGQGKLVNGKAHIVFDDLFNQAVFIDSKHPMHVFLQEQGDCNGLYFVPDTNGKGFIVKEKNGGTSNISFSYRITAKRRFFQDHRFGFDSHQGYGNNLEKAEYIKPRPTDPEEVRVFIQNARAEKQSSSKRKSESPKVKAKRAKDKSNSDEKKKG